VQNRTAAEADAAIRRLPVRLRSSRLVPGGGLAAHEGSASHRGHTIGKHVEKTRAELTRRFQTDPNLKWSSSFADRHIAETAIAQALDRNRLKLSSWIASNAGTLVLNADVGCDVGTSVSASGTVITTSRLRVVLRKEPSVLGYYIKTAFPMP
jgi:Bacterial CdiA-CT RNAse A domain